MNKDFTEMNEELIKLLYEEKDESTYLMRGVEFFSKRNVFQTEELFKTTLVNGHKAFCYRALIEFVARYRPWGLNLYHKLIYFLFEKEICTDDLLVERVMDDSPMLIETIIRYSNVQPDYVALRAISIASKLPHTRWANSTKLVLDSKVSKLYVLLKDTNKDENIEIYDSDDIKNIMYDEVMASYFWCNTPEYKDKRDLRYWILRSSDFLTRARMEYILHEFYDDDGSYDLLLDAIFMRISIRLEDLGFSCDFPCDVIENKDVYLEKLKKFDETPEIKDLKEEIKLFYNLLLVRHYSYEMTEV